MFTETKHINFHKRLLIVEICKLYIKNRKFAKLTLINVTSNIKK